MSQDDDDELDPVPLWLADASAVAPCPCGREPDEEVLIVQGDVELVRWFHEECLPFLRHEMNEEELQEMDEAEQNRDWLDGEDD